MGNVKRKYKTICRDDCKMTGCPGHEIEIRMQTCSCAISYHRDGEAVFYMDCQEVNDMLQAFKSISNQRAEIAYNTDKQLCYTGEDGIWKTG